MKKIILIILFTLSTNTWGQVAVDYNNPIEVAINLREIIDNVIMLYERISEEDLLSHLSEEQQESFLFIYDFCLIIKPEITKISHGERVYFLGFIMGAGFSLGFSFNGY